MQRGIDDFVAESPNLHGIVARFVLVEVDRLLHDVEQVVFVVGLTGKEPGRIVGGDARGVLDFQFILVGGGFLVLPYATQPYGVAFVLFRGDADVVGRGCTLRVDYLAWFENQVVVYLENFVVLVGQIYKRERQLLFAGGRKGSDFPLSGRVVVQFYGESREERGIQFGPEGARQVVLGIGSSLGREQLERDGVVPPDFLVIVVVDGNDVGRDIYHFHPVYGILGTLRFERNGGVQRVAYLCMQRADVSLLSLFGIPIEVEKIVQCRLYGFFVFISLEYDSLFLVRGIRGSPLLFHGIEYSNNILITKIGIYYRSDK